MINYQEIIDNLEEEKVIRLMQSLGADRYEDRPNFIIFPTICHNANPSEASMKLYYYKDKKFFMCYTEDGGMNIFKFLETYYKTREIDYNWYPDVYEVILNCSASRAIDDFVVPHRENLSEKYRKKHQLKFLETYPKTLLDVFVRQYPIEWLNDGITREAMDKFGIRFSISQNKIIIPHFDVNGNLVGIRGRALNPWEIEHIGKYMPVQIERKRYSHPLSLNLYGLNQNKQNIKNSGIVYVFEAEKSVLQMENFSIPNCAVAICGSNFNKFQLNILLKECAPQEIVLCFDKEEKKGSQTYFNKLYGICERYKNYCNFSFVYDIEGLLNMKDSPSDKGEVIFRRLLDRRVKVK